MRWREFYRLVKCRLMGHHPVYRITRYDHDYWAREFVVRERVMTCRWCRDVLGVETDGVMAWTQESSGS